MAGECGKKGLQAVFGVRSRPTHSSRWTRVRARGRSAVWRATGEERDERSPRSQQKMAAEAFFQSCAL